MSKNKTQRNSQSVQAFIDAIEDDARRKDCKTVMKLMKQLTKAKPAMWGDNIVGYGIYHYQYASGRDGEWFLCGFSPRKQNLTLYLMAGFDELDTLMSNLGKYKTGKCCLYIKKMDDIDIPTLEKMVIKTVSLLKNNS